MQAEQLVAETLQTVQRALQVKHNLAGDGEL